MLNKACNRTTLILLIGTLGFISCKPPLAVHNIGSCVVFDVRSLGEYPRSVTEMEILTESGELVWRARVRPGADAMLHKMKFCAGSNDQDLKLEGTAGKFDYDTKEGRDWFELRPGARYIFRYKTPGYSRPAAVRFEV